MRSAAADPPFLALPLDHGRRLRLFGELDISTVGDLTFVLESLPEPPGVLDLAGLTFMDASGLHAFEQYAHRTRDGSGPLVLENVPPHILRLFEIAGADGDPDMELRTGAARG